ncbi:MAG: hypothetical protein AAF432_03890 [Planctomycetota bacterium]
MNARHVTSCLLFVLIAAIIGCDAGQPIESQPAPPIVDAAPTVSYDDVRLAYNARVDQLTEIYSRGVVELKWRDEAGKQHVEPQVDLDMWINLPRHTSFRLEKLGEVLLWAGSDAERFWLFDMLEAPTALVVGDHASRGAGDESLRIAPLLVLDMMGLAHLPDRAGVAKPVTMVDDSWRVETVTDERHLVIYLDAETQRPRAVELLGDDGQIRARSIISREARLEIRGVISLNQPFVPSLIDIDVDDGAMSMKIALGEPTADGIESELNVVFDRNRLAQSLRPDEIVEIVPAP